MNRITRGFALAVGAAGAFAACSAAPQENSVTSVAPLDPNQVATPTSYTIKLSQVHVIEASEPNQTLSWVGTSDSCGVPRIPNYTPDTGYVDWAQIGFKISSTVPGSIPFNDGNPETTACSLGSAPTGATLTQCKGGALTNGVFNTSGTQLALNFTVNPGDQVELALALDNIEYIKIPDIVAASQNNPLATTIKDVGDGLQLAGAVFGVAGVAIGGVVGMFGNGGSVLGDLLPQDTSSCSGKGAPTSCVGGLISLPGCNNPSYGDHNCVVPHCVTNPNGNCQFTSEPLDALRIVDPATGKPLTAERLQELTAVGPVTFRFNPIIDVNVQRAGITDMCDCDVPRSGANPVISNDGCVSNLTIDFTISRDWTTGLAESSKSADMAVVRAPGTIDLFNQQLVKTSPTSTTSAQQIVHHAGAGTSFGAGLEAPASTIQSAGVDWNTAPAVVSRTPNNVDAFWVDSKGGLYTVFAAGPSFNWSVKNIFAPGWCEPIAGGRGCEWFPGVLPADARVSAVAQSPENLVVFAMGSDGNLYNSWWATSSGVDSAGLPNWASPAPITTSGVGAPGGSIASIAQTPQALDVFYIGKDGGVWTSYWNECCGWATGEIYNPSSPGNHALAAPGAPIAATARTSDNIDVFFVGTDGGLWTSVWSATAGKWATWEISGTKGLGLPGAPVSAVSRQPGALDVVFQGPGESRLNWAYWTHASGWNLTTIPTTGGGDLGVNFTPGNVSLVAPTSFSLQLFYLDAFREPNTLTWSDPTACNTLQAQGCTSQPGNFPWSTATILSPPY
jgi:hypothetical protein